MALLRTTYLQDDYTKEVACAMNRKKNPHTSIPELHILLATVIVLFAFFGLHGHAHAAANIPYDYNCGPNVPTQQNPHCYYYARWGGAPGAYTGIFTNEIYSGSNYTNEDFITNELWLGNDGSSWVEVGLESDVTNNSGAEFIFWADQRPGHNFAAHPGNLLQRGDFGHYAYFEVLQTASNTYSVYGSANVTSISGTSTSNTMPLNDITVGGEVDGSSGASASIECKTFSLLPSSV